MRASAAVNCRFGIALPAFRSSCQAAAGRFRAARSGVFRSRRCRDSAPSVRDRPRRPAAGRALCFRSFEDLPQARGSGNARSSSNATSCFRAPVIFALFAARSMPGARMPPSPAAGPLPLPERPAGCSAPISVGLQGPVRTLPGAGFKARFSTMTHRCQEPMKQRPVAPLLGCCHLGLISDPVAQHRDEGGVGRRHREVAHPVRPRPSEFLTFPADSTAVPCPASVQQQQELFRCRSVGREAERRQAAGRCPDPDLLAELPSESRLRRFARLQLAAWKFPEPGHGLAFGTSSEQNPAVGVDQGGHGDQPQVRTGSRR